MPWDGVLSAHQRDAKNEMPFMKFPTVSVAELSPTTNEFYLNIFISQTFFIG